MMRFNYDSQPLRRVAVSSVEPGWGMVVFGVGKLPADTQTVVVRRGGAAWTIAYAFNSNGPGDGACAFAPAAVVGDLLSIQCPPWPALHARHATPSELTLLRDAFRRSPLTRIYAQVKGGSFGGACISRLDAHWAAASVGFPDTVVLMWFHRIEAGWTVVFENDTSHGTMPPRRIMLSLASCSGYNASGYGA